MVSLSVFNERFVLISFNKILNLYDLQSEYSQIICTIDHEKDIVACIYLAKKQLLIYTDLDKALFLYDLNTQSYLQHEKIIQKRVVKLITNNDESNVLLADKTGDVYSIDLMKLDNDLKLLMGHLSMLLDFSLTRDEKFLITCDRDEKIRISHYPNSYNIHAYLLAHCEFVRQIELLNENSLLSSSGDEFLILWNLNSSKATQKLNMNEFLNENEKNQLKRGIYRFAFDKNTNELLVTKFLLKFKYTNELSLDFETRIELDQELVEFTYFSNRKYIFVLKNGDIQLRHLNVDNQLNDSNSTRDLFLKTQSHLKDEKEGLATLVDDINEEYTSLFKSKVDNMHDYYDRKAQRLARKRSHTNSLSNSSNCVEIINKE